MPAERFSVKKADVWGIVSRAFPDYTGRKFVVSVSPTVTFHDLHWGGGTRNSYVAVELVEGGKSQGYQPNVPWNEPAEGATVEIPRGVVVVERSWLTGKDVGITIHVRPDDLQPLLPSRAGGGMSSLESVRQAALLGTLHVGEVGGAPLGMTPPQLVNLRVFVGDDVSLDVMVRRPWYEAWRDERSDSVDYVHFVEAVRRVARSQLGTGRILIQRVELVAESDGVTAMDDAVTEPETDWDYEAGWSDSPRDE